MRKRKVVERACVGDQVGKEEHRVGLSEGRNDSHCYDTGFYIESGHRAREEGGRGP